MKLDERRAGREAARGPRRQRIVVVMTSVAAGVLVAACDGAPPFAKVDGGTPEVALLGYVVVPAKGGDVVTIRHASPPSDEEALTHAFVGGTAGDLPPIFTPAAGGLSPTRACGARAAAVTLRQRPRDAPCRPSKDPPSGMPPTIGPPGRCCRASPAKYRWTKKSRPATTPSCARLIRNSACSCGWTDKDGVTGT